MGVGLFGGEKRGREGEVWEDGGDGGLGLVGWVGGGFLMQRSRLSLSG